MLDISKINCQLCLTRQLENGSMYQNRNKNIGNNAGFRQWMFEHSIVENHSGGIFSRSQMCDIDV